MIQIQKFVCNPLQENTYVVSDDTQEAIIIDCGAQFDDERNAIVNYIHERHLKPVHLISTHGHFDHNFGNDTIWREFGLKPEVPAADEDMMDLRQQVKQMMGVSYGREVPPVGRLLTETDTISFGTHKLTIIATPGHTPGSVTFYCQAEGVAFTGDTLFRMSIGRTDFEGGSWNDMQHSLRRLALLPADTKVYSGHGPMTTIGDELRYNPYMH